MTLLDKTMAGLLYSIQLYSFLASIYFLLIIYVAKILCVILHYVLPQKLEDAFNTINLIIGIYCSLYLIWRYNTFNEWLGYKSRVEFTHLDRVIALHAGILLFGVCIISKLQSQ
jgi:hypothetical protein